MFTAFPCVAATLATFFFFNDTATTEIYTLSLHDALPILCFELGFGDLRSGEMLPGPVVFAVHDRQQLVAELVAGQGRSEEHTSELQSQSNLVCRLLLEKKKRDCHTAAGRHSPSYLETRTH